MYKLFVVLIFFFQINILPNAAQPGFWSAGGTGTFSLLFPEDSLQYKKIQMVKEVVSIQLYRGYAVVKGEYWMHNTSPDSITIKVGYPINSSFNSNYSYHYLTEIKFDSLYGLRAYRNQQKVEILSESIKNPDAGWASENWYVWNNTFTPSDTTLITVYFIVNTNNTIIRKGYSKNQNNGFIYLLETGATWKQPIVEGEVRIRLMEGLSLKDIKGLSPDSIFTVHAKEGILIAKFQSLSPTFKDNIVIAYSENLGEFNFQNILKNEFILYEKIDKLSSQKFDHKNFKSQIFDDPFDVSTTNWLISILMIVLFAGIPLYIFLGVLTGIIILVVVIAKKIK